MKEAEGRTTQQTTQFAPQIAHSRPGIILLVTATLTLAVLWVWSAADAESFAAQFEALSAADIEQGRIDTAVPPPQGETALNQTFTPRHNGLHEIEVTLLRHDETRSGDGLLLLQLFDDRGDLIAESGHTTSAIDHNQVVSLTFKPQPDSKDRSYRLRISATPDNTVSVWGYSLDAYAGGRLSLESAEQSSSAAQDLRFVARYQLTWRDALAGLSDTLFYEGLIILLILVVLPLPGVLLLLGDHAYRRRHAPGQAWDPAAWWGAALALGIAAWPILWLWLTMVGGRWTTWLLAVFVIGGWVAAVAYSWHNRVLRNRSDDSSVRPPPLVAPWRTDHLILLALLILAFAARLVAVRDTPVLPWVDASRHALVTAVMAQNGQVISDYAPYLPVDRFPYHFGFHTLSSTLLMLSGWPLERLLLVMAQLLNALTALTIFAAVWLLVERRRAAYLAAFLVALPFFFPAYYATWGRLTQLTAVLLLPVLLAFTWQLIRGRPVWINRWWLPAVAAAGLFLIHFRVFLYFLPFPAIVLLVSRFSRLRWVIASAVLSAILVLPRLFTLLGDTDPVRRLQRTIPDYNTFPSSYLTTGWEQAFIVAAALGLVLVLIAAVRRMTWTVLPLTLLAWVLVLFALLSLDWLGIPIPSIVNLNSMYIMLFVPLSIFLGVIGDQVLRWFDGRERPLPLIAYGLMGVLLAVLLLYGLRRQVMILNPQTLLTSYEDMPAVEWLDERLPAQAHIAVNSWRWLGQTWAVADGGAWLLPLTGRSVTTPPIDYVYNRELSEQVIAFNAAATAVEDWSDPAQVEWLQEQGVTHIFAGKRGGFFDPAQLSRNPLIEMIYSHDGAFIFALKP